MRDLCKTIRKILLSYKEKIYWKLLLYVIMDSRFFGYRMAKSCDSGFAVV